MTLLELVIAVAVLLILLAMMVPNYQQALKDAKVTQAIGDIKAIETEILFFEVRQRRLPASLAEVGKDTLTDPWGQSYRYLSFVGLKGHGSQRKDRNLVPINSTFDLYSVGEDGNSVPPLTAAPSQDDIVRANDGSFVGLASNY